jgi:hypothetical protein
LQIDEKLLSYTDLQAEADDLYAKHGFRTYVVPRYPIFYDLSDLGEAEYRKDVKKRISELNTDGKPYIVVDLNLEKDLDFKGEVIASSWVGYSGNKGSSITEMVSGLDDETKARIITYTSNTIKVEKNMKLDDNEVKKAVSSFSYCLDPNPVKQDECEYPIGSDLTKVKSIAIVEHYYDKVLTKLYRIHDAFGEYGRAAMKLPAGNPFRDAMNFWLTNKDYFLCTGTFNPYPLRDMLVGNRNTITTQWLSQSIPQGSEYARYKRLHDRLNEFYESYDDDQIETNLFQNKFKDLFDNKVVNGINVVSRVNIVLEAVNKRGKEVFKNDWCDINAAEIKAKSATEAVDFTNLNINGANANESKYSSKAPTNGRPNLGAFDDTAKKAAKEFIDDYVDKTKFTLTDVTNPTLTADDCLPLIAAYYGTIINEFAGNSAIPPGKVTNLSLKTVVLLTYLTGAGGMKKVLDAAKVHESDINKRYQWNNLISYYKYTSAKGQEADASNLLWRLGQTKDGNDHEFLPSNLIAKKAEFLKNNSKCLYDKDFILQN